MAATAVATAAPREGCALRNAFTRGRAWTEKLHEQLEKVANPNLRKLLAKVAKSKGAPDEHHVALLKAALAGQVADMGDRATIASDVASFLVVGTKLDAWCVSLKMALIAHQLLWEADHAVHEAFRAVPYGFSPQCTASFVDNMCGQGVKQRPMVVFFVTVTKQLLTMSAQFPLHELIATAHKKAKPQSRDEAFVRIAAGLQYLQTVLRVTDVSVLTLDALMPKYVMKRVVSDMKLTYVATWRVLDYMFSACNRDCTGEDQCPSATSAELQGWIALYDSFTEVSAAIRVFFNELRATTVDLGETIPELQPLPRDLRSRLVECAAWKETQSLSDYLGGTGAPSASPKRDGAASEEYDLVSESSTDSVVHGMHARDEPKPMPADSFIDGSLSDDDDDAEYLPTPFADAARGQASERFVLGDQLGQGSFGQVFRAFDAESGNFVAVKQLNVGESQKSVIQELSKEFEVLRSLEHSNIVNVLAFLDTAPPRIVMEWMPGGSVQAALKMTRAGFRENVVARYTRQLLAGLAFLHGNNVVHRDIKPGNMLLSATGELKLSDFGTCRILSQVNDSVHTGTVVGTICYLAPECFKGAYSPGSDMWAVGCSVLEMLTGRLPWSEKGVTDNMALIFMIGSAAPPAHHPALPEVRSVDAPASPASAFAANTTTSVTPNARSFLEACFAYDAKERPSASELLKHPFLAEHP